MEDRKRDTDVKNKLLDYVGEGQGGMIWENSTETYILPYVKQMTSSSSVLMLGTQSWCSKTIQKDGVGREVGEGFRMRGHVHPWLIHVDVWQKLLQYCKVIILQLNKWISKTYLHLLVNTLNGTCTFPWCLINTSTVFENIYMGQFSYLSLSVDLWLLHFIQNATFGICTNVHSGQKEK